MKIKLITIATITACIAISCNSKPVNSPKRQLPTQKQLQAFDGSITKLANELKVQGLSYALVSESEVIQVKGLGNATENTVYPMGAMANVFASTIIYKLAGDEKLDPKNNLSEYGVTDAKLKSVSIKNLLSYTNGNGFAYEPNSLEVLNTVFNASAEHNFGYLLKKKIANTCNFYNTTANNLGETVSCTSTVTDLAKFSIAIDSRKLLTDEQCEQMFRPTYLKNGERAPSSPGWFVQFYNNKKFAWSFGCGKGYSALIIKSLSDSLSLVVMANSENLNAPFQLQNANLWQSPVALSFLKIFTLQTDSFPTIDLSHPSVSLQQNKTPIESSKHRDIIIAEIIAHITLNHYMGNKVVADSAITAYQRNFPFDLPYSLVKSKPRTIIAQVGDYVNISHPFTIETDTNINIFAFGEFGTEAISNPWNYDNVEMYLDMKHKRATAYNNTNDKQLRFNYDSEALTGNYSSDKGIVFAQRTLSESSYVVEIKLPWATLDSSVGKAGRQIGFDIGVSDGGQSDAHNKGGACRWHFTEGQEPWANPSVFGALQLTAQVPKQTSDSVCASVNTTQSIIIDAVVDAAWQKAQVNSLKQPKGKSGIKATFRSLWNSQYLYFYVEVTNAVLAKLPVSADYGFITAENNDTIWRMTEQNSGITSGEKGYRFVNQFLPIKAGNYQLHYVTNASNSYNFWVKQRPQSSFYGIGVY